MSMIESLRSAGVLTGRTAEKYHPLSDQDRQDAISKGSFPPLADHRAGRQKSASQADFTNNAQV